MGMPSGHRLMVDHQPLTLNVGVRLSVAVLPRIVQIVMGDPHQLPHESCSYKCKSEGKQGSFHPRTVLKQKTHDSYKHKKESQDVHTLVSTSEVEKYTFRGTVHGEAGLTVNQN